MARFPVRGFSTLRPCMPGGFTATSDAAVNSPEEVPCSGELGSWEWFPVLGLGVPRRNAKVPDGLSRRRSAEHRENRISVYCRQGSFLRNLAAPA